MTWVERTDVFVYEKQPNFYSSAWLSIGLRRDFCTKRCILWLGAVIILSVLLDSAGSTGLRQAQWQSMTDLQNDFALAFLDHYML